MLKSQPNCVLPCRAVLCRAVTQLVSPGEAEVQKLVLAAGRVSDDSPLLPGYPIEFANAMDIGRDGVVYLSVSTDVLTYK